jgi:hypothetical protein
MTEKKSTNPPDKIPPVQIRRSHRQTMLPSSSVIYASCFPKNKTKQLFELNARETHHINTLTDYYLRDWEAELSDPVNQKKSVQIALDLLQSHPLLLTAEAEELLPSIRADFTPEFEKLKRIILARIAQAFPNELKAALNRFKRYNKFTRKLIKLTNLIADYFAKNTVRSFEEASKDELERICTFGYLGYQLAKFGPEFFYTMDNDAYQTLKSVFTENVPANHDVNSAKQSLLEVMNSIRVHGRRIEVLSGGSLGRHWYCCRACRKVQDVRAENQSMKI